MRQVFVFGGILLLLGVSVGLGQTLDREEVSTFDFINFNETPTPGPLLAEPERTHYVGNLNLPQLLQGEDTFATYAYTYGDIVIFSYADSNNCEIQSTDGTPMWSGVLMEDEYALVKGLGANVYMIFGTEEFTVLTGDPFTTGIGTWYAVDQSSRPLSTKLLSVGPHVSGSSGHVPAFVVFAYYDSTHVVITNIDNQSIIWEGDLDSAEFYRHEGGTVPPIVYSAEATKPISTMCGGGLGGMYIPAFNGTFTGRDFMTYQQLWRTGNGHDLEIVPWEDSTTVTVTVLGQPDQVVWQEFFPRRGVIKGRLIPPDGVGRAIYIHSDKDISVPQVPWVSYTAPNSLGFFLMRGIDRYGLGIGEEFFIPIEGSQLPTYPSRLHVIAFEDGTDVMVERAPRDDPENFTTIWQGTLDHGEFYRYTCQSTAQDHAIYHVVTSEGVATMGNCRDLEGSDFLPLWFAIHPDVAAVPSPQFHETECAVPTRYEVYIENNGNIWDVIDIYPSNSMAPDFVTTLSDSLGGTLPDVNSNTVPDTDTLPKGGSFQVLADVTPSDTMPFGTVDTCFFNVISARETDKQDTAHLITTIREVAIEVNPDTLIYSYPGEVALFSTRALNTSWHREDTVNLTWTSTEDPALWSIRVTELTGDDITDIDTDGEPDVAPVQPNQEAYDFQVRVSVPLDAIAGTQDTVFLVGTSNNYPLRLYPTVTNTALLIVQVEPAPAILIRPDTTDSTLSGMPITYPLEVYNNGNGPDVPRIEAVYVNRPTWPHRLLLKDGSGLLPDTDGDGEPDMGSMAGPGGLDTLLLEVHPPYSALSGWLDSTIVYTYSVVDEAVYDSAIVVTKVRGIVDVDIEPDTNSLIHAGEVAEYRLRVSNWGGAEDTIAIWSYSDIADWTHEFSYMDDSPLSDLDNDGYIDAGAIDSAQTVVIKMLVSPPADLGDIVGDFDTMMVENRYVCVRTHFTDTPDSANDSVLVVTTYEPLLDIHNYPNPFAAGSATTFAFSIPSAGYVTLRVYNRAGEHVRTLVSEELGNDYYGLGGTYYVAWDGLTETADEPAPGVYLYTLQWRDEDRGALLGTRKITKVALIQP